MIDKEKIEKLKEKEIILFGTGNFGKGIMSILLSNNIEIICFIDNDNKKWGKMLEGKQIKSPSELESIDFDLILITSMFLKEIFDQLISLGIDEDKIDAIHLEIDNIEIEKKWGKLENLEALFERNRINVLKGEKIRVCFLFQIASFWPSWDTLWRECNNDDMIDLKVILFDKTIIEATQMKTAKKFLEVNRIDYTEYHENIIDEYKPHIIVIQTPYDATHRPEELWADRLKSKGYRIIYIPYGIEISDTIESRDIHFKNNVVLNSWKVYTFSKKIKEDYLKYSNLDKSHIKELGHPKFDSIYNYVETDKINFLKEKAGGKEIVLWKVHFPKYFKNKEDKLLLCTPYIREYENFSKVMDSFDNFFYIFMAHPKFYDMSSNIEDGLLSLKLLKELKSKKNVYIFEDDDYRPGLLAADYIMIDRSSLMVEAGATQKPILYLSNDDYKEPMTTAIEQLINSYYQGTGCEDMIKFLEMCKKGEDSNKNKRISAFNECITFFDGLSGYRIKEDMINSLLLE